MGEQASGVNAERAFHRPSCRIPWAQAAPCLATQRAEGAVPIQRVSAVPRSSRPAGSPTKAERPPANRSPQLSSRAWGLLGASWGSWGCWGPLSLPLAGPLSALCACRPAARGRSPMPHRVYTSPATLHQSTGARKNHDFDGRSPCYQQPKRLNQANCKCLDSFAPCKA